MYEGIFAKNRLSAQEKLLLRSLDRKGPGTSDQLEARLMKDGSVVKRCTRHLTDLAVRRLVRKYGTHYGQGNWPHPVWIITDRGRKTLEEES